ncbi:MAG: CoA transferase [Burkholderiales bacterium]|jgi:succinate---hydroxymethylglutarate CoA-transferase|nr:CoA transferase [Burkholderiales bacterium]
MTMPLAGLRVIAIEQYGAGPFGTLHLADLGAEVIKIENPHDGGDVGRNVGPHFFGPENSHFFQAFNRNKKSIKLDLKHPEGKAALHALVKDADAVFNNLRGDIPERMGLTYSALKQIRPDIVCAHLSAYGREGQRASWPGYDYLMQAEAGYLSLTGEPDGPPSRFGLSMIDLMTGTTAALALVSAVLGARATGKGRDIDVSLFDVAMHNLAYLATWYLNGGHHTGRAPRSAHPSLVPSQLYQTQDGWIFIMCNKEKFWPILADKMSHPEWSARPEFKTFKDRLANKSQFNETLEAEFLKDTTKNWMKKFEGIVPAAPVYDVAQALDNPFVHSRQGVINALSPDGLSVAGVAAPIRCPGESVPANAAPGLGEHTHVLLKQAGLTDQQIAFLREHAVI